jgi:hypothetical protein
MRKRLLVVTRLIILGGTRRGMEALRLAAHETKRAFKSAELAPFELRSTDIGPAHLAPSTGIGGRSRSECGTLPGADSGQMPPVDLASILAPPGSWG